MRSGYCSNRKPNLANMTGIEETLVWHRPHRTLPSKTEKIAVLFREKDDHGVMTGLFDPKSGEFSAAMGYTVHHSKVDWWTHAPKGPQGYEQQRAVPPDPSGA